MPSPSIETPEAFEAAIEASLQVRRERLLRAVRNRGMRTGIALGLAASMVVLAFTAFVAGDREAATLIALMAFLTAGVICVARNAGLKKALDSLREMDRST